MRVAFGFGVFLATLAGSSSQSAVAQPAGSGTKSKVSVDLVSSVQAVVPGKPFEVGLRFQLADGWHIYWQNSGDSGMAPSVTWSLPDGFSAGALEFPVPKRHLSAGTIVTNIIEGEPVLLTRITPPAAVSDAEITLSAKVRYLICQKTCIQGSDNLELKLPVGDAGSPSRVANEDVFVRARKALPQTSSKHLSIAGGVKPVSLEPGKPFELALEVNIKRGFHIQSHTPLNANFIAADVFLERVDDVTFEQAVYPKPKMRTVKYLGKVSEYAGRTTIRIPASLDAEAQAGPRRFGGILRYQACNDKGTCFPPAALAFAIGKAAGPKVGAAGSVAPLDATGAAVKPTAVASTDEPSIDTAAAPLNASVPEIPTEGGLEGFLASLGLPGILLGCFLYGLLINATPCVLPLLSIKVLGFVQQAHESRSRTLALGLAFGAGVMILFVVLGFLAAAGTNILQFPAAVIALATIVMVLALSMLDVYTLNVPTAATKLEATIQKEGILSSFGKGALAPVLGFACVGPMMVGAFGWATQQPPQIAFFAFLLAGLGMASPYMLLGANPGWLSFLPRPGNWMITFERVMGFLLLGMVVLLLHPVVGQLGGEGLEWTLVFLVVVAFACWVLGRIDMNMSLGVRWRYRGSAGILVVGAAFLIFGWIHPLSEASADSGGGLGASGGHGSHGVPWAFWSPRVDGGASPSVDGARGADECGVYQANKEIAWGRGVPWQLWSPEAVAEAVGAGKCAFVDFTADYCTNCKVNKAVATHTQEAREKMMALDVIPFQGDFSEDERVFILLQGFGRHGVPFNLIYPPGKPDAPVVLRTLFGDKGYLLDKLDEVCTAQVAAAPTSGS